MSAVIKEDDYMATYSAEDNKIRLYCAERLDDELYKRVKAAKFGWAPKQDLFYAHWNPRAEDLALELAGFIGDESTSLAERAEQRAERFEGYQVNRANDAESAYNESTELTKDIPLGQPILVGHHSEKKARKQADKIERAMNKAVKMWETSEYWAYRASGVIASADYKDRAEVRARRIKKLQAENRKYKSYYTPNPKVSPIMQKHHNYSTGVRDGQESKHVWCGQGRGGSWVQESRLEAIENYYFRYVAHNERRLAYELAILEGQGELSLLDPPKRPKKPPILNYSQPEGFQIENRYNRGVFNHYPQIKMTKAQYSKIDSDHRGTELIEGTHRIKVTSGMFLADELRTQLPEGHGRYSWVSVFLTDSKAHSKPEASC